MVASADPEQEAEPTEATGGFINGADPLDSPVGLFLLQVVIIMATTRVLAAGLGYLKQPRVIAEILAGIILVRVFFSEPTESIDDLIIPVERFEQVYP
jgi:hypothetical protein